MIITASIMSLTIGFILVIWFKTEAVLEYAKLLHIDKFLRYSDYKEAKKEDAFLTYHSYLRQFHDSFFIRLITCPICLATWLSLILSLIYWIIPFFVVSFPIALSMLPVSMVAFTLSFFGGLILYGIIDKLI